MNRSLIGERIKKHLASDIARDIIHDRSRERAIRWVESRLRDRGDIEGEVDDVWLEEQIIRATRAYADEEGL